MKKTIFGNSLESRRIQRELEILAKDSKEEYKNATSAEREAMQLDLGLQKKAVPNRLVLKGKEVLEVSRRHRRGSSPKTSDQGRYKRQIAPAMDSEEKTIQSIKDSNVEEASLNVVMKGQGVLSEEKKETKKPQDIPENFTDLDSFFVDLFTSGNQTRIQKPAIISQSKTTKSIALGTREQKKKRYEPPKRVLPKKQKNTAATKKSSADDLTLLQPSNKIRGAASPNINLNVERNLTFDDLDEEFYDIMREKLKIDIDKHENIISTTTDGKIGDDNDVTKVIPEIEENIDQLDFDSERTPRTDLNEQTDLSKTDLSTNINGKILGDETLKLLETGTVSEIMADEIIDSSRRGDDAQYDPLEKNVQKDTVSKSDKLEDYVDSKAEHPNDLLPVTVDDESRDKFEQMSLDEREDHQAANVERHSIDYQTPKPLMNMDALLKDLFLSNEVSNEDIIRVLGEKASALEKPVSLPANSAAFVSKETLHKIAKQRRNQFLISWTETNKSKRKGNASPTNIHHFCTSLPAIELPNNLKSTSRYQHTPDKYTVFRRTPLETLGREGNEESGDKTIDPSKDIEPRILTIIKEREKPTEDEIRLTDLAAKILDEAMTQTEEKKAEKTFMKLQNIVDQLFDENDDKILQVSGQKLDIKHDETRLYWTLAPPKFDIPPDAVKHKLIPEYQGTADTIEEEVERLDEINDVIQEESSSEDEVEQDDTTKLRQRIIDRSHGSASIKRKKERDEILRAETRVSENEKAAETSDENQEEARVSPSVQSISEMRKMMAKLREDKSKKEEEVQAKESNFDFVFDLPQRRTASQPVIKVDDFEFQKFDSDYDASVQELEYQSKKILAIKEEILNQRKETEEKNIDVSAHDQKVNEDTTNDEKVDDSATDSNLTLGTNIDLQQTPSIEQASNQGQTACSFSKVKGSRKMLKRKGVKVKKPDVEHEKKVHDFLLEPPRKIERSMSLEDLKKRLPMQCKKRRKSLTDIQDFQKTIASSFNENPSEMFFWTKENFWYKWLDELYPPSVQSEEEELPEQETENNSNIDEEILQQIEVINPESETASQNEIYQLLINEIDSMTSLIESTEAQETLAIHLCRRGACYRKTGNLKKARDDLERAIDIVPKLLDAYWHRHLLFLLQGNSKRALEDLDYILNHNTNHVSAYRSRAELYKKKGDFTSAIFNYSQAIRLRPDNADVYYERAYMFQQRGDVLLALEDFKQATILLPGRTEGIRNVGIYHFENRSWTAAINDFTALLMQEPYNEEAYTYRGRAYANMSMYQNSLKDLSTAIHLNPNNRTAFYFRGCLLRRVSQRQSLQDLSTSILLDDSVENVNAYLHRGILYTEMKRWDEATADFEAALRLNSHIPAAHVNLGLIQMTKMNNPHMAIRRFNIAVRVDPTYVRAYICRAEAFQKLHHRGEAILDYTRAIHLRPDVTDYRMTRGKLLMEERRFELASYHIKQCAAMSKGSGISPTQQAAVQAFLKNYNEAIELLEKTVKSKHIPQLYTLLGKTKMKAKLLKEAIESFGNALKLMKPWDPNAEWPFQAAEVYFYIGMSYTELIDHSSALDAFNNALKINPEYSEAYYQRGLAKMKLRHAKAVQDFNRALAYNPKFFQAYLSRAAYYGMKERYAKAILNCNEAIRLRPTSIRGYLYRGALKYFIKAYKLAVKDLTAAIAIDSSCNLAYFNRAVCYQEMKHYQRALKDYGVVLLLEKKDNMKVLQNRGLLYLEVGDVQNALKDFSSATQLEPKNPKLHHTLGICYHRLGLIKESVACFSNALKTDKFFVDAYLGRGNSIMDFGTTESTTEARRDFLRALHLNPTCLPARVSLAYTLQVQGRFKAAWSQFTKCIDIDENFKSAYEGRAIINLQMGNMFGALLDINQALKIEITAEFLTNRGVINQFMGDTVNAMKDYQAALRKDPSYSLAYYNAANLYFHHRQFQQALEFYDRAIGWNNNDESAILNRAITRVMLKNVSGALEDFNLAAKLSPLSAHIYFNRGNLNASLGCYDDAEKDYTKALSLQPGDALVYKRRADVRGKLSKKDEALSDYKKAIRIQTRRVKV